MPTIFAVFLNIDADDFRNLMLTAIVALLIYVAMKVRHIAAHVSDDTSPDKTDDSPDS